MTHRDPCNVCDWLLLGFKWFPRMFFFVTISVFVLHHIFIIQHLVLQVNKHFRSQQELIKILVTSISACPEEEPGDRRNFWQRNHHTGLVHTRQTCSTVRPYVELQLKVAHCSVETITALTIIKSKGHPCFSHLLFWVRCGDTNILSIVCFWCCSRETTHFENGPYVTTF